MDGTSQLTHKLIVSGQVQGVGFRPFIYNLAVKLQIKGSIKNITGQVEIYIQASAVKLALFKKQLINLSPSIAKPIITEDKEVNSKLFETFSIENSIENKKAEIHIPVDYFSCDDCIKDINNPDNFRYQYPFTNCTQCGPRYTLINKLPYDRSNTVMTNFDLCENCKSEYLDPKNRRFHAEPIACPECGPHLSYKDKKTRLEKQDALNYAIEQIKKGKIIAIKGIGGYHFICDAYNEQSIKRLRKQKGRPKKPLAVMFLTTEKGVAASVEPLLQLDRKKRELLNSYQRPIVLCTKKPNCDLPKIIAPNLNEIGAILPYSPLHHLLLSQLQIPLICTSGNISGEPVITDNALCEQKLANIADGFLHHNRPIVRPADDSVYRQIGDELRPIRLGRGRSPIEITLPFELKNQVVATGAQMKNTVAIGWDNRIVISPHIGELSNLTSQQTFESTIKDLSNFYHIKPEINISDKHPSYHGFRWAKKQKISHKTIQHHKAHASALVGEYMLSHTSQNKGSINKEWLIFCWDGVGLGDNNTLWGGETLLGKPGHWQRIKHLKPFNPIGGDKAARQAWRSTAAIMWQINENWQHKKIDTLAFHAWKKQINSPQTTAMGRLFDTASFLAGLEKNYSYEGQGPAEFENLVEDDNESFIDIPFSKEIDWTELMTTMADKKYLAVQKANIFHNSLAQLVVKLCVQQKTKNIGLCGGVFQNHQLVKKIQFRLAQHNLSPFIPKLLPVNDAVISFGQIIEHHFGDKT